MSITGRDNKDLEGIALYDISFLAKEIENGEIEFRIEYITDLLKGETIERWRAIT